MSLSISTIIDVVLPRFEEGKVRLLSEPGRIVTVLRKSFYWQSEKVFINKSQVNHRPYCLIRGVPTLRSASVHVIYICRCHLNLRILPDVDNSQLTYLIFAYSADKDGIAWMFS